MKYFILISNIALRLYSSRKEIMLIEFSIIIRSVHDIACKC